MKEMFSFTSEEISILLYRELIRLGKVDPKKNGTLNVTYNNQDNRMKNAYVEIEFKKS